jgi:hypothetical protein
MIAVLLSLLVVAALAALGYAAAPRVSSFIGRHEPWRLWCSRTLLASSTRRWAGRSSGWSRSRSIAPAPRP